MRRKIAMFGLCLAILMNTMIVAYAADVTADPDVSQSVMSAEDLLNATTYMQTNTYGTVTGNVTYKYNNYRGNVADTGSEVILVSKSGAGNFMPDESRAQWGIQSGINELGNVYGVYITKVDGTGAYTFNHIPVGEYLIFIQSYNTTSVVAFDNEDKYKEGIARCFSSLLSDANATAISDNNVYNKYHTATITVYEGETTVESYDFGTTYL